MTNTWERRDFIALILIPLLMVARWAAEPLSLFASSAVIFTLTLASTLVLIRLYRDLLAKDWAAFRRKLWLKVLICIVGVVAIFGVLTVARMVLPIRDVAEVNGYGGTSAEIAAVFSILFAFIPLFIAFQEEVILRHVLFFKHRGNKALAIALFFISAFLFGLIHINSFGGDLLSTVPYMFVGAFFNLLYLLSKNIWFVLVTHLLFNFLMAFLPAVLVPIMLMLRGI